MKKQELTRGGLERATTRKLIVEVKTIENNLRKKEGVPRPSRGLGASYGGGANNGKVDTKNS